jgi:hypothetical protein
MAPRFAACAILGTAAWLAAVLGLPSPAYPHKPITTTIHFKNEIAQIFQRKCFQCHSENNLGVSLTSYAQARPWARAIREEILERKMPPWTAVPGYGHFSNDISLNAREMEVILSWTDGGAPSGVPKAEETVPAVYVPAAPVWDHGAPDRVLKVGAGHTVEAGSPFEVERFVVSTGLLAPTRLRAIALKQGDRRVVRHAAFYEAAAGPAAKASTSKTRRSTPENVPSLRGGRWLGSWTPWQTLAQLPHDTAYRLPAGARIIVEVGYAGGEETVTDTSEVGLYLEKDAGAKTARGIDAGRTADALEITAPQQTLAARSEGHRVRTEIKVATPVSAVALWPTPSAGARSIEITATTPEGVVIPLLWVKDFRPEWRSSYVLSSPVTLTRGTRVAMTTYFDNPSDQPTAARAQAWITTIR